GLRPDSPRRAARGAGPRWSEYHGRLYHNFRNDILDAVPHEIRQRGGTKNLLRRNQFGFSVSGPVVIPKLYDGSRRTFFSLNYEGVRERIARSSLRTVAIEPERRGDFSLTVDQSGAPLRIYDPATVRANPLYNPALPVSADNPEFLKDPFPANRIPDARQDPVARRALEYYPLPNANAGPFFRNNYFIVSPETNTADGMIGRLDHTFLEKHRLSASWSFTNGFAGTARLIQSPADSAPADGSFTSRRGTIEHILTLSPQTVHAASFEVQTNVSENVSDASGWPERLGLRGVPSGHFPFFDLANYIDMGRTTPAARTARNTFAFSDSLSHKRGRHSLRFFSQFSRLQVNTFSPAMPAGAYFFTWRYTSLPGVVNTGLAFASFLLGGPE
ncbi:MAG: hypothetical protein ACPL7M_15475, partial [Bryobacteraceae bacterium]